VWTALTLELSLRLESTGDSAWLVRDGEPRTPIDRGGSTWTANEDSSPPVSGDWLSISIASLEDIHQTVLPPSAIMSTAVASAMPAPLHSSTDDRSLSPKSYPKAAGSSPRHVAAASILTISTPNGPSGTSERVSPKGSIESRSPTR
jgi:hypothetical protein